MKTSSLVIIYSGYNTRAVTTFIRTLERKHVNYAIVARDQHDPVLKTQYKNHVEIVRSSKELSARSIIDETDVLKNKHNCDNCLIVPSTEYLNRLLVRERAELEQHNITIPIADEQLYQLVSDKKSFVGLCKEYNIRTPKEFESLHQAEPPFVAKPNRYFSKDNQVYYPVLIFNEEQKQAFTDNYDAGEFHFQEYIGGESYYLLYYYHRDGTVYKFSQQNLIQQPGGKSIVAAVTSDMHHSKVSDDYERLFKDIHFHGLVMVEVKKQGDECIMIEANPRLWGPSQLFVDAQMNFFDAMLHDYNYTEERADFSSPVSTKYFWFGGIDDALRKNAALTYYDYDEQQLLLNLDSWLAHDIYKRADSIDYFKQELTSS